MTKIYNFLFLIIFFCIGCGSTSSVYVKTYPGVLAKDAKEEEKFFFFNEKLLLLSEENDVGRYKEEVSGKNFFIPKKYFSSQESTLYYSVDAKSGLFLRSEPSQNSKKIILMPYKSSGKILDIKKEFSIIDTLRAPWLKIEFKNQIGWAFAGYVHVFKTEEELKDFLKQKNKFELDSIKEVDKLTSAEISSLYEKIKPKQPEKIYENEDYEILDFRFLYKEGDECNLEKWNQLVFRHKLGNEFYSQKYNDKISSPVSEKIISSDYPLPSVISTQSICCWCCCPCHSAATYFLSKDKPYFIQREITNSEGKTSCVQRPDGENYYTSETEARIYKNDLLYTIIKNPPCEFSETGEWQTTSPMELHFLIQFKDRNFSYEKKITRKDKIPEEFKESYDRTVKVVNPSPKSIDFYKVLEDYTKNKK